MKKLFLIAVLVGLMPCAFSQTQALGRPFALNGKLPVLKSLSPQLPLVDNATEVIRYAKLGENNESKIKQYGTPLSLDIDFFKHAQIDLLTDGTRVLRYRIRSKGAKSLNFIFSKFHLAEGTTLYISANDKSTFVGAYSSANNNVAQRLGTDLIYSDDVIIELQEPAANKGLSELQLSTAIHGFVRLDDILNKALNSSGSCNLDVNCPQGAGWEIARNSVAMIMNSNGGFCTGSLVYNTSGALIPYFLTANHCGTDPSTWIYRFRWESPAGSADCGTSALSGNGPEQYNINGGILRARSTETDFMLVELNTAPDPSWEVIYAGWDRATTPPPSATCIHHPDGDIKKITLSYKPAISTTYSVNTLQNGHWKAFWDDGVTEGGSSGSPLFNNKRRIVGQLSGGASGCLSSDQSDAYGKFSESWKGKNTDATRLSNWLDPNNTDDIAINANVENKLDPLLFPKVYGIESTLCSAAFAPKLLLMNGGSENLFTALITYTIDGTVLEHQWNGSLGLYESDTVYLPIQTLSSGNHTFSALVSKPNLTAVDDNINNNTVASSFYTIINGKPITIEMNLDCFANETSWEITDQNGFALFKSPNYAATNNPYTVEHNICLNEACFEMRIYDVFGDGMTSTSCTSGSYSIRDSLSNKLLLELTQAEADFGSSLVKEFCVGQASIENMITNPFQVYPNPFTSGFMVDGGDEIIESITLVDLTGKVILEIENLNKSTHYIEHKMNSGCYYVTIKTEKQQQVLKLIKLNK